MADIGFVPFPSTRSAPPQSLPSTVSPSAPIAGDGSPEGQIVGVPGTVYTDRLTKDLYIKIAGTGVNGWQINGKALGVVNGLTDVADDGSVWVKDSTGWHEIIAAP